MTEQEIQDRLKQNIPAATEHTPAPVAPVDTTYGQATTTPPFELDEMIQYKLHDLFDEQYQPTNEENRQRLAFIYGEVTKLVPDADYGYVAAKIRDLIRIIGIADRPDKIYRLYQWLKLDKTRRNIEAEMGSITYG